MGIAVLFSSYDRGATAAPWARRYGTLMARAPEETCREERKEVTEMPVRHPQSRRLSGKPRGSLSRAHSPEKIRLPSMTLAVP